MPKLETVKPDETLYDVNYAKREVWSVRVVGVDLQKKQALVSWNMNEPKWVSADVIRRYARKKPSWW